MQGKALTQDDLTHHYQDDPYPGGITLTVFLSDKHRVEFLKRFAKNGNFSLDSYGQHNILEWFSKREESMYRSRYVLNQVSSIEVKEDKIQLGLANK